MNMFKFLKCNGCDGIFKESGFNIHFCKLCDNDCKHCIDKFDKYIATEEKPNVVKILETIDNGDYLKLNKCFISGGEPFLYMDELLHLCEELNKRNVKCFINTALPITCYNDYDKFLRICELLSSINISVQHYDQNIADIIRNTKSNYDRNIFIKSLPNNIKNKTTLSFNIIKSLLGTKKDFVDCIKYFDNDGFQNIKFNELVGDCDDFLKIEDMLNIKLPSSYSFGCNSILDTKKYLKQKFNTTIQIKRLCFLVSEKYYNCTITDTFKIFYKLFVEKFYKLDFGSKKLIYQDGFKSKHNIT